MEKSNKSKSSPKDVFMHLLMIVSLYSSVISFITLWFQYVNWSFPDPLNFYYGSNLDNIRWSSSVMIITFPIYIFMSWVIGKDFRNNPAQREMRIRKWLIYLTLFIAAVTIAVDLITLVYNFYGGELTIRFLLKVFVVLISALAVFGYYFIDLKATISPKKNKAFAWVISIVIIASIITGFFIVGSPSKQRLYKFDERRINDLQMIQGEIINQWIQKEKLPAALGDLKNSISGFAPPKDPETNADYEYKILSNISFELCAVFKTKGISTSRTEVRTPVPYYEPYNQNWEHGIGRVCFKRDIDPQIYKKVEKVR